MKAMIATGVGVLALGGLLVANSGRSASAQSSLAGPAFVNQADANRTTLVNCGEGRQALVFTDPRTGQSQVQCVGAEAAFTTNNVMTPGMATAMPVSQFVPAIVPAQPAPQVVYRDPVVPAARSTARRSSASPVRTASSSTDVRSAEPVYSRTPEVAAPQTRTWKKSAIIIGGTTAAGAGVGAVMGGKSGAVKGGVVGLLGGTIYDIATRNKH
jgi:hypothetical protein